MTDEQTGLTNWLRMEFAAEQEAGFSRLKRVPDTRVIRFLDHFEGLDSAGQSALIAVLVDWSSHNLLGTPPNPIYEKFAQATAYPGRTGGLRYTGVSLLAGLSNATELGGLPNYFRSQGVTGTALVPPPALLPDSADLVPIKIPSLRRMVKATFAELFAPRVMDIGSETWRFEGQLDGSELKLDIRFSGRMGRPQLCYTATVQGIGRASVSPNLCFESVFGVGFGQWDYLTKENSERSVQLLAELVKWLARLPQRLPPACCRAPD